jgi:hypothetical protein
MGRYHNRRVGQATSLMRITGLRLRNHSTGRRNSFFEERAATVGTPTTPGSGRPKAEKKDSELMGILVGTRGSAYAGDHFRAAEMVELSHKTLQTFGRAWSCGWVCQ